MPHTGNYRIEAIGAAGGYDLRINSSQYRGRGARMIGTFRLNKGEVIQIPVGQEGGINKRAYSSGGGGGTFVVRGADTPLIIAGRGGGKKIYFQDIQNVTPAQTRKGILDTDHGQGEQWTWCTDC